jgi:serralysin
MTVSKSGNKLADAVLSGYEWSGNAITFAFPDHKNDYNYTLGAKANFSPIGNQIENAARRVLDSAFGNSANDGFSVEGFTKLKVSEGSDSNADIRYAESKSANPAAFAYYPSNDPKGRGGDAWFGTDSIFDHAEVGGYAFFAVLHETGHALGLKHGHEASSDDLIKTTLHGRYDSHEYSVMTYHSYVGHKKPFFTNDTFSFPQSYMMADIRALQHMYGANFSTNKGNTVYEWSPESGDTMINGAVAIEAGANYIFATVWDGGGNDTYDLSAYSNGVVLDLRPGRASVFRESQLADLGFPGKHLASGNIYNALLFKGDNRSLIEKAIGGSGNDRFIGNEKANTFTGSAGNDTFVFRDKCKADTITDFGNGADRINIEDFGFKNFNKVIARMDEDAAGVTIKFGHGDAILIKGATIVDLGETDFLI